ncbi:MAG: alpha/beta fold hydrolase [Candidatus Nanopelagicales bacterium]
MSQDTMDQVKPGCEPFAAQGSGDNARIGVVLVHGFTGSPDSTVPWARYLNERGFTVNAIRLPGHGTTWEDANTKRLVDLERAVDDAFEDMTARTDTVFLMAQSFGGALVLRVAAERADKVAGVVLVNPWVRADGVASWQKYLAPMQRFLPYLTKSLPGVASDIADPSKAEIGYDKIPVVLVADALNSCFSHLKPALSKVSAPLQLALSATDHVLATNNAELIRAEVRSPIEEVTLDRSYHVATLDYDAEKVFASSVQFIEAHSK